MTGLVRVLVCAVALGLLGCSEASSTGAGGIGGDSGVGGDGGYGGGGVGGVGDGPIIDYCLPANDRCTSRALEPHRVCCEPQVPNAEDACNGDESMINPTSCTATGERTYYRLSLLEVEEDCDIGYDLDHCQGEVCTRGSLASGEGADGVDNGLAGLATILNAIGADLTPLNEALSDGLCGMTDSFEVGTCDGGGNDGQPCTASADCLWPEGSCDVSDGDCLRDVPRTEVYFEIDANPGEGCARVAAISPDGVQVHILNLSDDGCLSGSLGSLTLRFSQHAPSYEELTLAETMVRLTLSSDGLSHGVLGAILNVDSAIRVIEAATYSFPDAAGVWWADITTAATSPNTLDRPDCDGLSATFRIGAAVEELPGALLSKSTM